MPSAPVLLLDVDQPLAQFNVHFWNEAERCGFYFDIAEMHMQTKRYLTDHIVHSHRKQSRKLVEATGWFRALPVTPGSQEGVEELQRRGVDIWLCTKPLEENPSCRDEKGAWVAEHFPKLLKKLIITPDKSMCVGDVLLDDAPKVEWFDHAMWRPVLFTEPFNGQGSIWEGHPHWTWGDDIECLMDYLTDQSRYRHGDF